MPALVFFQAEDGIRDYKVTGVQTCALPICDVGHLVVPRRDRPRGRAMPRLRDRKSTRLNSSHLVISYAVFCLKKKKTTPTTIHPSTMTSTYTNSLNVCLTRALSHALNHCCI